MSTTLTHEQTITMQQLETLYDDAAGFTVDTDELDQVYVEFTTFKLNSAGQLIRVLL